MLCLSLEMRGASNWETHPPLKLPFKSSMKDSLLVDHSKEMIVTHITITVC